VRESNENSDETLAYWTIERMAKANTFKPPPTKQSFSPPLEASSAREPVYTQPYRPPWIPQSTQLMSSANQIDSCDYQNNAVSSYASFPWCAIGKLFMSFPDGDYQCIASVVYPDMVITSAHCLYNRKTWGDKIIFVPAYNNHSSPLDVMYGRKSLLMKIG